MDKNTILKLRKLGNGLKVLYVEDDQNIAKQLERILRKIFPNIDIEINGEDGLKKYEQEKHDIVITDILMPIMNGIKMSHLIKKINKNQVIIVTSAHSEMKYMSKLIDIGVSKFVLKPIDLGEFLELLGKVAIKIYKDRKESALETQKARHDVFAGISNPVIIIENNELKYVNEVFKENFLSTSDSDIKDFKMKYLFKNKKMMTLDNSEIFKEIINSKKIYELLHINSKLYKAYKVDVIENEEENQFLLNFINIDFVINDLEKSSMDYSGKFQTKRDFLEDLHHFYEDTKPYSIFCFGLKNLQTHIKECGAKHMEAMHHTISLNIQREFSELLKEKNVSIYLFSINRYILIVNSQDKGLLYNEVVEKLKDFGNKYKADKGHNLGLHLDYIAESLNKELSKKEIINNTGALLYMLQE